MLEERIEVSDIKITNFNEMFISISLDTVIYKDDIEIARSSLNARGFVPGELQDVKDFTGVNEGELINALDALWSADVILKYDEKFKSKEGSEDKL